MYSSARRFVKTLDEFCHHTTDTILSAAAQVYQGTMSAILLYKSTKVTPVAELSSQSTLAATIKVHTATGSLVELR